VNLDIIVLRGLCSFVLFICAAFFFQRFMWRRRRRLGRKRLGFYPSSAAMGNALQSLQVFAEPQVEHILEEKLEEAADEDDSGGPDDPTRHLHRQVRKLRQGKRLERLTALKK
jgi:hypothetical protein